MRKRLAFSLMVVLTLTVVVGVFSLAYPVLVDRLQPQLLSFMAAHLSDEERQAMYDKIAENFGSAWDTTPEPDVARLARRNWTGTVNQAPVQTNNAGLRSSSAFVEKKDGVFRIVCLGDSFVFGGGGLEEDRFCNQLEEFYRVTGVRVEGKPVETYAVGLGSWTMIQEATYLAHRISEYEPDLILMLSTVNDITESSGVTGAGVVTNDFSPESREQGSGIFHNRVNMPYGGHGYAALQWGLSESSRRMWLRAIESVGRLVELQHQRGGKLLLSSLNSLNTEDAHGAAFPELFRTYLREAEIEAPTLEVTYLKFDKTNRLPHDGHPSRKGHRLLVDQYVHAFDRLGWLEVPKESLPSLAKGISVELNPEPDPSVVVDYRRQFVDDNLHSTLDFGSLSPNDSNAFLGGIFPESKRNAFEDLPWASVRAGFLLALPKDRTGGGIRLVLRIPERRELFPFRLDIELDGRPVKSVEFQEPNPSGDYRIEIPSFEPQHEDLVEIVLRTESYFAEIRDPRMKSYQLVSAEVGIADRAR